MHTYIYIYIYIYCSTWDANSVKGVESERSTGTNKFVRSCVCSAAICSVLQCVAMYSSVLQCVAVCCIA